MSDPKKDEAKKDESKADDSLGPTRAKRTIEELELENSRLIEQLKLKDAEAKAASAAASAVKRAEKTGEKVPRALVHVVGKGRRNVKPGDILSQEELEGFTEGVQYELA